MNVAFETYAPMFVNYENYIENENYDDEIRIFEVPKCWAIDWVFIEYRMGFDEFLESYTWDDTHRMYSAAVSDKVIVSDTIKTRKECGLW